MGFTPQQVDEMTAFQFMSCSAGYAKANGVEDKPQADGMSEDRMRDLGIL